MADSALLRMSEVADYLGIGRSKAFEMVAKGELPAPIHLGARAVRISRAALDQWISDQQAQAERAGAQ